MIVVSDTTAISNLIQIGELGLLRKLYGKIVMPAAVFDELMMFENAGFDMSSILKKDWLETHTVKSAVLLEEIELILDKGEAEAIVLAIEMKADLILIDEKQGRSLAQERGVPIIGTIGILLYAKQLGFIYQCPGKDG